MFRNRPLAVENLEPRALLSGFWGGDDGGCTDPWGTTGGGLGGLEPGIPSVETSDGMGQTAADTAEGSAGTGAGGSSNNDNDSDSDDDNQTPHPRPGIPDYNFIELD